MPQLLLYSLDFSPSSQRVLLALAYKGIDHEVVTVDITKKERPEEFIRRAPLGRIPVLVVDEEHVIWESNVINQYLDEAYPQKPLFPTDPIKRAEARKWMRFSDEKILDLEEDALPVPNLDEKIEHATTILDSMALLNQTLKGRNPYFMGDELSLVDLAFIPPLRDAESAARVLNYRKWDSYSNVHRYMDQFRNDPIFKSIVFDVPPDKDLDGLWHSTLKDGNSLPAWKLQVEA